MNTSALASKYNFGINNLRLATAAAFQGMMSERQSSQSCMFVPKQVSDFEDHVPRFGGQSFG